MTGIFNLDFRLDQFKQQQHQERSKQKNITTTKIVVAQNEKLKNITKYSYEEKQRLRFIIFMIEV